MSLLPKHLSDVYTNSTDIFTPLSNDLHTFIKKAHRQLSPGLLMRIDDTLTKAYRHAPPRIRELIPDCRAMAKKLIKQLAKLDVIDKVKRKKLEADIHVAFPIFISDLAIITKELSVLSDKEAGNFYVNLPNKFTITVGDYDSTGNRVEYVRNPVIVSITRPLDGVQMEQACMPNQLETFLYTLEKGLLIGFYASDVPVKLTEEKLRSLVYKFTGKSMNVALFRMKHPTSKRIWFLIDELNVVYKSIQFADRELAGDSDLIQTILAERDEIKIISMLIQHGFSVETTTQISVRLANTSDISTRHQILSNEILNLKRLQKTLKLKHRRESFLNSQKDIRKTINLLEDDRQKSREDQVSLRTKFQILTSVDADPETGLQPSQYNKIDEVFARYERMQTRNIRDSQERKILRRGLKEARMEARELYYQIKYDKLDDKKRLKVIRKLSEKIDTNRVQSLHESGGKHVT